MGNIKKPATLEEIAKQFNITPNNLGSVLIVMSSTTNDLVESVNVAQDVIELYNRNENGEELTDDEIKNLKKGVQLGVDYVINKYFDRVESDPEKYLPKIQKTIDILSEDRQEGESLDDCIARVLKTAKYRVTMSPESTKQAPSLTPEATSLLFKDSVPLWNAQLTNVLSELSVKNFREDLTANTATLDVNDDLHVTIEGLDTFNGLSPSPLKLLDAIIAYFTFYNPSTIDPDGNIQTTIEIPLREYAKVRGIDLYVHNYPDPDEQRKAQKKRAKAKYNFKKDLERDLNDLSKFRISGKIKKGNAKGDYQNLVLIYPDHSIKNNIIQVTIPDDTARYLIKSHYITPYDPDLQRLDDRNPNSYRIARKISLQHGNKQNQKAGTSDTLKVSTLIDSTPFIPDLDTLERRGSRNWKEKVKLPLEETLNGLVKSGFLVSWTYRDPRSKNNFTPKEVNKFDYYSFDGLNVIYRLKKENIKKISPEVGTYDTPR